VLIAATRAPLRATHFPVNTLPQFYFNFFALLREPMLTFGWHARLMERGTHPTSLGMSEPVRGAVFWRSSRQIARQLVMGVSIIMVVRLLRPAV